MNFNDTNSYIFRLLFPRVADFTSGSRSTALDQNSRTSCVCRFKVTTESIFQVISYIPCLYHFVTQFYPYIYHHNTNSVILLSEIKLIRHSSGLLREGCRFIKPIYLLQTGCEIARQSSVQCELKTNISERAWIIWWLSLLTLSCLFLVRIVALAKTRYASQMACFRDKTSGHPSFWHDS